MDLKKIIRNISDFPEPGVQFKDIESITEHPKAFRYVIDDFSSALKGRDVDKILVLDARGFLFGAALGYKNELPIVMVRKMGKPATGGTAFAAARLIQRLGGKVALLTFVIELQDLNGRALLQGMDVVSLVKY